MADKFPNVAFAQTIESAATTLTFSEINFGMTAFDKKAMIVHEVHYYFGQHDLLVADNDYVQASLTTHNQMTGISLADPSVFDMIEFWLLNRGTPASAAYGHRPYVRKFSDLPGGGLLVPLGKIYLAVEGVSIATAATVSARLYFTLKDLKPEEFWELVEATRIIV